MIERERPDVASVDYQMPEMDGLAVIVDAGPFVGLVVLVVPPGQRQRRLLPDCGGLRARVPRADVGNPAPASLTIVAGNSDEQSWTANLVANGFFLIPMMAAAQLRPWVGTTGPLGNWSPLHRPAQRDGPDRGTRTARSGREPARRRPCNRYWLPGRISRKPATTATRSPSTGSSTRSASRPSCCGRR